jgi:hypothetical protein
MIDTSSPLIGYGTNVHIVTGKAMAISGHPTLPTTIAIPYLHSRIDRIVEQSILLSLAGQSKNTLT